MDTRHPTAQQTSSFQVIAMSTAALAQTAALHEELLPNGLFPALGRRFLRHWHQTFITSPYGFGLTAFDQQGNCCGFLIGTTDQRLYTLGVLRRNGYRLAALGAVSMATRPRLAVRFMRTRAARYLIRIATARKRKAPPNAAHRESEPRVAVLHALITEPSARGRGVAAALLGQFEQELRSKGVPTLQLVTLETGGATGFYRRLGYVETDRRINRDGEAVVQFDRHLGEKA
ncbi:GNAT family N-acetyltransferase [Knoellia koreensis]|uniref:GNAT family N-acetyltransferase n=1 Tax=Knoellia koreensis TaxID=2730921 RepID=A0A849HTE3_9MICO|nr:GNAT family N-acetyltransferase [Knoellia sp. DB2414S]NNM47847.1 GNAT family N-acetyltransferase [Knoellia sp. DB2414S]